MERQAEALRAGSPGPAMFTAAVRRSGILRGVATGRA